MTNAEQSNHGEEFGGSFTIPEVGLLSFGEVGQRVTLGVQATRRSAVLDTDAHRNYTTSGQWHRFRFKKTC
jgi:hypothetical protein